MTFTPTSEILGSSPVNTNFSFAVSLTLLATETVESVNVTFGNTLYFNYSSSGNNIIINGNVPLDIFDQYSFKYIDKGKSDKNQTPVVCKLVEVPDHKELFEINVDGRTKIDYPVVVNVSIKDTPASTGTETSEGSTPAGPTITEYTQNYVIQITQTYSNIHDWTDNYFKNRY